MTSEKEATWEHFRDSARADRNAWEILLNYHINDLAAYHMQQSVEKYFKAVIMKYALTDLSPKGLGHMPIERLFTAMKPKMLEELKKHMSADVAQHFVKLLYGQMDEFTHDKKYMFWKMSLGIIPTKHDLNTIYGPKSLELKKFLNISTDDPVIKSNIAHEINRDFKSEYTDDPKLNAWSWIFHSFSIFLFVFPHMDIGRYPTMIDKRLSTDVYNEYHDGRPRVFHIAGIADFFRGEAEYILSQPG